MKISRLRVAFIAVLALLGAVRSQAVVGEPSTKMKFGYTVGNLGLNLGYQFKIIVKGAIQLPAGEMERLGQAKITALRVAVGCELSEQNNYVFITDNLEGEFLYKQKVENLDFGWNEITLDEPFEINGRELYVGFRYESAGDALSLDGEADNNLANWLYISQTDDNGGQWVHQSGGALNVQAVIEGDELPQCDVELNRHTIAQYAGVNQQLPLWVVVRNLGAATVSSLDVDVALDGQTVVSHTVDGLSIESGELSYVNIGNISFDSNNICDISVNLSAVNGEDDLRPDNNSVTVPNVIVRRDYTQRKVLLEHFSTMLCSNCPSTHKAIEDALRFRNGVIHVVHHAGFKTDALTIPASEAYLWFYTDGINDGSVYAPAAMLDRVNMSAYGATSGGKSTPGPVFSPQRDNFGMLIDNRLSAPALLTVDISNSFDPEKRILKLTVGGVIPNGSPDRLNVTDPRLTVMLTEDGIPGDQKGVSWPIDGPYIHDCVLRSVLTDEIWGDPVNFESGNYLSKEYSIEIPAEWNADKLTIVAFVSDFNKQSSNDCKILNADCSALDIQSGLSMPSLPVGEGIAWRPQISGDNVCLPEANIGAILYSVSGMTAATASAGASELSLADVPAGVYVLVVMTPEGCLSARIIR